MHQEDIRQKQIFFVLLGGFIMTLFVILVLFVLGRFVGIQNVYINYLILFVAEFGYYCLSLFLYKQWVSKVVWFGQGFTILILLTLFKIITSSMILYFILPHLGILVLNFVGLLGLFVRGFLFELPFIALAAKIFETDIFKDQNNNRDNRIIDNQLK